MGEKMDEKTWKEKEEESKNKRVDTEEKVKKSLKYSILDGGFATAMVGFGENFFSAFAVFLKASNFQISMVGSLPRAMGSFMQLFSHRLLGVFKTRKRFLCCFVLLQALMYLPIALVFFFGKFSVNVLIVFLCFYYVFGMIASSAWSSWMGDLVSSEIRGKYFSKRSTIAGFVSFASILTAGYILQQFNGEVRFQYIGFLIIFMLALISRLVALMFLLKQYEPGLANAEDDKTGFIDFLKNAGSRNYGVYILFLCFLNFSVYIAGPFFAAYMLYDLKLNYIQYTMITGSAVIARLISLKVWGRVADKYGTKKVMTLAAFLIPMVSVWWLFSGNMYYLMAIEMYSGFAWAGFELTSFNFLLETITPSKRTKYIAYYNVLNGGALLFGALLGGLVVKYNTLFWSKYMMVFLVSGVLRLLAIVVFIPRFKEVREVESDITYPGLVLNMVTDMTTRGFVYDVVTFRPIRDWLKKPLKEIGERGVEGMKRIPRELRKINVDKLAGLPETAIKLPGRITRRVLKGKGDKSKIAGKRDVKKSVGRERLK